MKTTAVVLALGLALLGAGVVSARRGAPEVRLLDSDRDAAIAAVQGFVTISTHLARSGGDARFADRLPAMPEVVDEVMGGLAFTRHSGRREEPQLIRVNVSAVEPGPQGTVEVATAEYWVVRGFRLSDGAPEPQPRVDVVRARYTVQREGSGWKVASWTIDVAPPPPAGQGG